MIFKSLFKGRDRSETNSAAKSVKEGEAVTYKSFVITPAPQAEGGQFRVAGRISAAGQVPDEENSSTTNHATPKTHEFVRADLSSSWDDACALTVSKAKRIIDERGDDVLG